MAEVYPQPGASSRSSPPRRSVVGDELGFARYVHQPIVAGQRARKDVVRFRCARNHYLRLSWFIELAWTRLDQYRQEIHKLVGRVEKELFTHADTTLRLSGLSNLLRSKTEEYSATIYMIASRVRDAQMEIACMLERSEVEEAADADYEPTDEVVVTLPTHSVSHRLIRYVRRVIAWIRRGSFLQKPPLSSSSIDAERSLLQRDQLNTSYGDIAPIVKGRKMQFAKNAAWHNTNGFQVFGDVNTDRETVANGDGLHRGNSMIPDDAEKWKATLAYSVMQKLWQHHRAVRKTLLTLVENLRDKERDRTQLQAVTVGRGAARLLVADLMNAVVAIEGELRAAVQHVANYAQQLNQFGAETWPGQSSARCGPFRDLQRTPSFWTVLSFLCCMRRC